MRLTFLGTGTSFGVPVVGCACATCTSGDPRDRRTRHAALIETAAGRMLVDTPQELRLQLVAAGVDDVDAVWLTHTHADHVSGIDDLRIFSVRRGHDVPAYIGRDHAEEFRRRYAYIFDPAMEPPKGTTRPRISLVPFEAGDEIRILGETFTALAVPHGPTNVYGFRVGRLGYVTDAKELPPHVVEALSGVSVLVLNAVWFGDPHPTHFTVEEAVEAGTEVGADRTFLVHLTHRVRHEELLDRLPTGFEPAYDGLTIDICDEEHP